MTRLPPQQRARIAAILIAACALAPAAASASGLDCGKPLEPRARADAALGPVITSSRMNGGDAALHAAVTRLRSEGVPRGIIIDHAVSAYCPLVAGDASLSSDQKREAVRRFASSLTTAIYDPDGPGAETAIILSLPVDPTLSRAIDVASVKAGQTRDAWIRQAIRGALAAR